MDIDNIKAVVEKYFEIDLLDPCRKRRHIIARSIYFTLCRDFSSHSLSVIGASLNKDHSTVVHATKHTHVSFIVSKDPFYTKDYLYLKSMFKDSPPSFPTDYHAKYRQIVAVNRRLLKQISPLKRMSLAKNYSNYRIY